MEKTYLNDYRLITNNVEFDVPIHAMGPGDSVFIPCTDTIGVTKALGQLLILHEAQGTMQERIEAGCLGVRVWRVR